MSSSFAAERILEVILELAAYWAPLLFLLAIAYQLQKYYLLLMMKAGGMNLVYLPASFAVPVHELSHYVAAKLCGHKIEKVRLFSPNNSGTLGYVNHAYIPRWYSPISNALIGIAPLFGGALTIYILTLLLMPELRYLFEGKVIGPTSDIASISLFYLTSSIDLFTLNYDSGLFWVWFLLVANIAVFCVPSPSDFKGASLGMFIIITGYVLLTAFYTINNASHDLAISIASIMTPFLMISMSLVALQMPLLLFAVMIKRA